MLFKMLNWPPNSRYISVKVRQSSFYSSSGCSPRLKNEPLKFSSHETNILNTVKHCILLWKYS